MVKKLLGHSVHVCTYSYMLWSRETKKFVVINKYINNNEYKIINLVCGFKMDLFIFGSYFMVAIYHLSQSNVGLERIK